MKREKSSGLEREILNIFSTCDLQRVFSGNDKKTLSGTWLATMTISFENSTISGEGGRAGQGEKKRSLPPNTGSWMHLSHVRMLVISIPLIKVTTTAKILGSRWSHKRSHLEQTWKHFENEYSGAKIININVSNHVFMSGSHYLLFSIR